MRLGPGTRGGQEIESPVSVMDIIARHGRLVGDQAALWHHHGEDLPREVRGRRTGEGARPTSDASRAPRR
jgi:hypothetical protein